MCTKMRVGGRNCPLVKCQQRKRLELQLKLSRTLTSSNAVVAGFWVGDLAELHLDVA
jgi:hypothetical protein